MVDLRVGFGVWSMIINAKACVGTILAAKAGLSLDLQRCRFLRHLRLHCLFYG